MLRVPRQRSVGAAGALGCQKGADVCHALAVVDGKGAPAAATPGRKWLYLFMNQSAPFAGLVCAPVMGSVAEALPELVGCRKWTLTAVLALAFMAEMADNSILQALYAPVGRALHASAVQLGTLTMWRGLVQVRGLCCRSGGVLHSRR